MLDCEGTIELIKYPLFSMNDKFYPIVDNLEVSVSNDYLYVKISAPLVTDVTTPRLTATGHVRQSPEFCPCCSRDLSFRNLSRQGVHHSMSDNRSMLTYF
jgi:hypothetical protein